MMWHHLASADLRASGSVTGCGTLQAREKVASHAMANETAIKAARLAATQSKAAASAAEARLAAMSEKATHAEQQLSTLQVSDLQVRPQSAYASVSFSACHRQCFAACPSPGVGPQADNSSEAGTILAIDATDSSEHQQCIEPCLNGWWLICREKMQLLSTEGPTSLKV